MYVNFSYYVTGPEKTGLIYIKYNCLFMVPISCSVYAIKNLFILLSSSWISAYMVTFYIQDGLQIKSYYILNSQKGHILHVDKTGFPRPHHIYNVTKVG